MAPPPMELAVALILIIAGVLGGTSAQYTYLFSDSIEAPPGAQLAPLPVIPLPSGLSTLLPSANRPQPTSPPPPRPTRPASPNRPIIPFVPGGGGSRPLPSGPKPPPIPQRPIVTPQRPSKPIVTPQRPSKPIVTPQRPMPQTTKPPRPPPPIPTLPTAIRPTPPPPPRPTNVPRPTKVPRPTTTTQKPTAASTTTPRPVQPAVAKPGGGAAADKETVFTVFKMSDDGSYLFDYTAPAVGLRQREEGFLKSIGEQKVPVKRGFFAYTSPEGKPISLSYQADENGFRATGNHLPRALSEV